MPVFLLSKINMDKWTGLYRYFAEDGRLLYVGVALNPIARLYRHRNEKAWVFEIKTIAVEWFPSRAAAFSAETHAIKTEHPKYNCADARSPNGEDLRAAQTRAGFDAKRRAGHVFGRRHSIMDFPERIEAMRPHIESGDVMTMHPQRALDILNAAHDHWPKNKRPAKIKSQETFRRWRRDGFPGYRSNNELTGK